ncbi:MAG: response regulator transcription factor, partial [Cyanobacteria bacterium CRU_2_1]|nr:response regulator transcription factor [Cyanobacteria bacterium CRU_2_1]
MSASPVLPDQPFLRLMLIDDDPVFRLGLRVWLEQFPDLRIVAETGDGETALQQLATEFASTIDLILLDISLGRNHPDRLPGLTLCQHLKTQYLDLPLLILSSFSEPVMLAAAQRAGANGYCPKAANLEDLVTAIRQVAIGRSYWSQLGNRVQGTEYRETTYPSPPPPPPPQREKRETISRLFPKNSNSCDGSLKVS